MQTQTEGQKKPPSDDKNYRNESFHASADSFPYSTDNKTKPTDKMKDRIYALMTRLGLSQQELASRLQVSTASISSIFKGRTNPTINHVLAIHRAFPEINDRWLLYGEGEMMATTTPLSPGTSSPSEDANEQLDDIDMGFFPTVETAPTPSPQSRAIPRPTPQTNIPASTPRQASKQPSQETDCRISFMAKNNDTEFRRVKEIRVFYDDNTYETFVPAAK